MDTLKEKKKVERVLLGEQTIERLDGWLSDLREAFPGIRIKRKDLIEWIVASRPPELSASDRKSIKESYFDEVAQAEWLLRQLREARENGKKTTLKSLLSTPKRNCLPADGKEDPDARE